MGTATIQVRVLAVAGARVWVAASGTLSVATLRTMHYSLCARVVDERTQFYLDFNEVRPSAALPPEELPRLLPAGRRLRFHIVGASQSARAVLRKDPRCRLYPDVAAAWEHWSRQP